MKAAMRAVVRWRILYRRRLRASIRCVDVTRAIRFAKALGGTTQGPTVHFEGEGLRVLAYLLGIDGAQAVEEYLSARPGMGRITEANDRENQDRALREVVRAARNRRFSVSCPVEYSPVPRESVAFEDTSI